LTRRLTVLLVLLVVLPTGLLAWLAIRGVRDERQRVAGQLYAAAESRLTDVDERIARWLDEKSGRLMDLTASSDRDAESWRDLVRTTPEISQIVVRAADGRLVHPPLGDAISDAESQFLVRIRRILEGGFPSGPIEQTSQYDRLQQSRRVIDHGWVPWYWDEGLHLLFWRRDPAGGIIAVELDRTRLMSDLLVALPMESQASRSGVIPWHIALEDSQGRVLSQTGSPMADREAVETVERRLSPPLGAWVLRAEVRSSSLGALGTFLRVAGLVLAAAIFGGLAFLFHRESSRELREASERVGFVNQVSHELRTPLTNIRLYAELLDRRLAEDDENRSYLDIIVAECSRLSRLIGNVLTFAQRNRGSLAVHPVEGSVDETLRSVAAQFGPSLEAKGMEIAFDLAATQPIPFDPDALEQIVGNLLSNVEKYAADGEVAEISSRQNDRATIIRVADHGPGIPQEREESVFEPFVRLSDRLTEGVSGTGIGLAIARELARLHSGELRLVHADRGACFELELPKKPTRRPR
jgi:signal transduction histidine kinase